MNKPNTIRSKLGNFPAPKQHGAWAMFIVPSLLAIAALKASVVSSGIVLCGFILVFLSYQPTIDFLRRFKNRNIIDTSSLVWSALLGFTGSVVLVAYATGSVQWQILLFGGLVIGALNVHLWLTIKKEHMSIFGELFGIAGLTASGPIMYIYLAGPIDINGWLIWCVSFLYFGGSVFYVKYVLRPTKRNKKENGQLIGYIAFAFMVLNLITIFTEVQFWIFAAFIPYWIKSIRIILFSEGNTRLKPSKVGIKEIMHSIYFLCVTSAVFLL